MENKSYKHVYFRIECGYMKEGPFDHTDECLLELQKQLEDAGWHIDVHRTPGNCPEASLGKSSLYCHPQSISGPVEVSLIETLENLFRSGKTYSYRNTDIYEDVYDFSWEELAQYHRDRNRQTIELLLLDTFKTKRSNLYKPVSSVINYVAEKISVNTFLKRNSYIPADVERQVVMEFYEGLVKEGHLTVTKGKGDKAIARANAKPVPPQEATLF